MDILDNIKWLGHDTFLIQGNKTIYTDPFELKAGGPMADIILITHEHRDHCSPDDIARIAGPKTTIVTTPDCVNKIGRDNILTLKPGESIEVDGVEVKTVRAYNTNKKFHPRDKDWVGFIFKADKVTYYHAGDTDHIAEMKDIKCDVALIPVSGTFVMTAKEAAAAAMDMSFKVAVPMHYASVVGDLSDAEEFASLLEGKAEVRILPDSR